MTLQLLARSFQSWAGVYEGRSDYRGGVRFLVGVGLGVAAAGLGEEVATVGGVAGIRCM